jgi:hypothetical protein
VYGSISDRTFIHQETIIDQIRPRIDFDYEKLIEFEVLVMEIPILNIENQFLKYVSHLDCDNDLFQTELLEYILYYKWNKYVRYSYFYNRFVFFYRIFLYLIKSTIFTLIIVDIQPKLIQPDLYEND